jgi:hypothetical protein
MTALDFPWVARAVGTLRPGLVAMLAPSGEPAQPIR